MAEPPDDTSRRLDEMAAFAREHGVVPAFRWPDQGDEVEGCFMRLSWGERGDGVMVIEVGAEDGSWAERYVVPGNYFETAVREASRRLDDSDEPFDPDSRRY